MRDRSPGQRWSGHDDADGGDWHRAAAQLPPPSAARLLKRKIASKPPSAHWCIAKPSHPTCVLQRPRRRFVFAPGSRCCRLRARTSCSSPSVSGSSGFPCRSLHYADAEDLRVSSRRAATFAGGFCFCATRPVPSPLAPAPSSAPWPSHSPRTNSHARLDCLTSTISSSSPTSTWSSGCGVWRKQASAAAIWVCSVAAASRATYSRAHARKVSSRAAVAVAVGSDLLVGVDAHCAPSVSICGRRLATSSLPTTRSTATSTRAPTAAYVY